jgi:hypothetical protein
VQYKELSTMIQTTTGSAFVTRGRGNPRGRGRVSVDKKSPTVATPSMPASSPSPTPHTSVSTDSKVCTKPCTVCGGMHWIKSCPIVKEAKEKHGKVNVVFSRAVINVDGAVVKESPIVDQEVSLHIQGGRDCRNHRYS